MKDTAPRVTQAKDTERSGLLSIGFAVLALVGFVWTWMLSVSDVLDPPDWIRIPGILLMPVALVVALATGLKARQGTGRSHGNAGLVLAALVALAFVVLLNVAG